MRVTYIIMTNTSYLSVGEFAAAWGVHQATILRRIARGDIQAINVSPKGSPVKRWRIPASEVNRPGMVEEPVSVKKKKAKR
jgi:hypothetical protein